MNGQDVRQVADQVTPQWLQSIPKVELHVHIEGSIPLKCLWELIQKYGGDELVPNQDALQELFHYRDFSHFLSLWTWKNRYLREYEDFELIGEAFARGAASQRIVYSEAFYSPSGFPGLSTQGITEALRRGLDKVPEVRVALIADLVRDFGPERGGRTLSEVLEVLSCEVIGVGIGGAEHSYPPQPFKEVFERARGYGLKTSAHAGEAAGPESIWGAVNELRVDRVGHATRAIEDEALLDELKERRVGLELCPLSNVCTGVIPSVGAHPIRTLLNKGLLVSVNSDDPAMFHNPLWEEFYTLHNELNFSRDEIFALTLSAIESSWLQPDDKDELKKAIVADVTWRS